jgi:hypothetical protein
LSKAYSKVIDGWICWAQKEGSDSIAKNRPATNLVHARCIAYLKDAGPGCLVLRKFTKEREILVLDRLIEALKACKKTADKTCNLLFPTAGCKPNAHFLENLKDVAKRAKLDPDNFWLSKFRVTFAT